MSNLIASMARFSTAMTMFGVEQLEKTIGSVGGGEQLTKTVEDFESTLNSLTDVLTGKLDQQKKETVRSISKLTEESVDRTMDTMEVMDPREALKASTEMLQRTTDVTAEWLSRTASVVEKATGRDKSEKSDHRTEKAAKAETHKSH